MTETRSDEAGPARAGLPQAYHASRPQPPERAARLRAITLLGALLWLGPLAAYSWGLGPAYLSGQPFSVVLGLVGVALIPVLLLAVLIELIIQSRALARTHRHIARLALASGESATDAKTALVSGSIRRELDRLSGALDSTLARVAAIEAMIENQVGAVERAGGRAQARAQAIRDLLQQERNRLEAVTEEMSASASVLVQAVSAEAGRVRQANEIAAREIREAEGLLARQMQSFRSLAEESGRAAHERVAAIEAAAGKLDTAIGTSLKNAEALSERLAQQHGTLAAGATRLDEERQRLEKALEAQDQILVRIQSGSSLTEALETALSSATIKVGETMAGLEQRSVEAGRTLRGEVAAASSAGESAAKAIAEAAAAAKEAASGLRAAVSSEMSALGASLGDGMHALDNAASHVGDTLTEASKNARLLVESLEDTVQTVETASSRLFSLLDQMGTRTLTAQNTIDNASLAMEERLGQVPELAAEHAARLSSLLEDQAHRMGALAESLSRRVQPAAPALPPAPPAASAPGGEPQPDAPQPPALDDDEVDEPINLAFLKRARRRAEEPHHEPQKETGLAAMGWIGRRFRRPSPLKALPEETPHAEAAIHGEAGGTGFWSTLFARIEGDDSSAPLMPQGAHAASASTIPNAALRTQQTLETLYALAIDLDRLLEEDPPMELWKRYRSGEPDAFARRLLALRGAGLEHRIRGKYRDDAEFRDHAERYRQRFGEIAGASANGANAALLDSPAGRLFSLLDDALKPLS
jgi:hypothetical protein